MVISHMEVKGLKQMITTSFKVSREKIGLPTSGVEILVVEKESKPEILKTTGEFYRVTGAILPHDPAASVIKFQMGLPLNWNGKLIQFGGGGLDGFVHPVEMRKEGRFLTSPSPMKDGYAVVDCDGGHEADMSNPVDSSWALNRETYLNFCYEAQKKTRDAAVAISEETYGEAPRRVYYCGGSNGGRETMKAIQLYGKDYDGAVCFFPVLYWVHKVIADARNADKLCDLGEDAWISAETWKKVQERVVGILDGLDGIEDGIVSDYAGAKAKENEVRAAVREILNEKQMEVLDTYASPLDLGYSLANGHYIFPGYTPYQGTCMVDPLSNMFGPSAASRACSMGSDQVIKYFFMKDADFDPVHFRYDLYKGEVQAAAALLDADTTDLDEFKEHNGKLLLFTGLNDNLVTPDGTIDYYNRLREKYGNETDDFIRFYTVPGYGHGYSDIFWMDLDLCSILDNWVEENERPETLIAEDFSEGHAGRTRPLYPYPGFPKYKGSGDPNCANNFENGYSECKKRRDNNE